MGTFGISWSAFSPKISARKTMFSNVLAVTVFSRSRPRSIDLSPNKKALYRINDERLCSTEATLPLQFIEATVVPPVWPLKARYFFDFVLSLLFDCLPYSHPLLKHSAP
jgi:hypothetical protein